MSATRRFVLLGLLGLCVLLIAWQRAALDETRRVQPSLLAAKELAARLEAENRELSTRDPAAGAASEADSRELLRLRNQVRQLRGLPEELAQLRAANARLTAQAQPTAQQGKLSGQDGYQPRESWVDAGLSSPEATVQTFFRAVRDQDTARLLQCLSEQGGYALGIRVDSKTGQLPPNSLEALRLFTLVEGYRIEARRSLREDKVALSLRATTGGAALVWVLVREREEWRIDRE